MLTEKDIENIEEYIRGNLDDELVSDLQIKIDSNPLYKKKYEELQVLSEAIHKYEEHKHIFDKIKAKIFKILQKTLLLNLFINQINIDHMPLQFQIQNHQPGIQWRVVVKLLILINTLIQEI